MAILFVGADLVLAMDPPHTRPPFWASRFPAVCQTLGSGLNSADRGSPSFPSCSVGKQTEGRGDPT